MDDKLTVEPGAQTVTMMSERYTSIMVIGLWIGIMDITIETIQGQTLTNVALKKPTLGDSMYYDTSISQPRYAVDGRTLTDVWHYTCFHSSDYYWMYNPNWWIVDLLQEYSIREVKITNRNIHSDRLKNFTVDIFSGSQDPRTLPSWPTNYGTVCLHQNGTLRFSVGFRSLTSPMLAME
ncbi:hypothetical protein RRG08_030387 [Elysia crispata]|uniref:F5/8 type C domain-containing protein n=1 Tax=Elysia crispata TaxID=231223 RepID=A0AAE1CY39_9GAST|nr:hypothetical protein RRG08_030387 [Elysia crispata]